MLIDDRARRKRLVFISALGLSLQERVEGLWIAQPCWLLSVGMGVAATAAAKLLRAPFEPFLQGTAPLMPFLPLTLLAAYTSGARAGFVSLALSFVMILMDLERRPLLRSPIEATAAMVAFGVIGVSGLLLATSARSSRIRLAANEQEKAGGEARYRLLSQEFQHRISNLVTVASSLAAMSARAGGSAQDMLARLQPRLAAYGRAQALVQRDGHELVSLAELVNAALQPFVQSAEPRIVIGPSDPVLLKAAPATALALALHELATNAAKYGALKTDGDVQISWCLEAASTVRLNWIEAGGPPVERPLRQGFGSSLIEDAFSRISGSSASLVYRREGVHCEFRIPCEPLPSC